MNRNKLAFLVSFIVILSVVFAIWNFLRGRHAKVAPIAVAATPSAVNLANPTKAFTPPPARNIPPDVSQAMQKALRDRQERLQQIKQATPLNGKDEGSISQ